MLQGQMRGTLLSAKRDPIWFNQPSSAAAPTCPDLGRSTLFSRVFAKSICKTLILSSYSNRAVLFFSPRGEDARRAEEGDLIIGKTRSNLVQSTLIRGCATTSPDLGRSTNERGRLKLPLKPASTDILVCFGKSLNLTKKQAPNGAQFFQLSIECEAGLRFLGAR